MYNFHSSAPFNGLKLRTIPMQAAAFIKIFFGKGILAIFIFLKLN